MGRCHASATAAEVHTPDPARAGRRRRNTAVGIEVAGLERHALRSPSRMPRDCGDQLDGRCWRRRPHPGCRHRAPPSGLRSRHARSDRRRRHVRARGHHDGPRERPSHRRDRNTGAERQDIPRSTPRATSGSYRANRKALVTRRPTANTRSGRLTTIQLDRRTSTAGRDGPRAPARELPGWPAATKRPVGRGAINRRSF